jgi:holo-[acyl-carrier protein] synthase
MSVLGLGIDLVEVSRIRALLQKGGDRFKERVYTVGEIAYCDSCADGAMNFAARFAAKEAVAKALGTGFTNGVSWKDIEVLRSDGGAPSVRLHGGAQTVAGTLGVAKVLITLTHTATAAAASAVLLGRV